ncbi:MAG: ATP-binding protein [Gammaproteobacteria bacterium]
MRIPTNLHVRLLLPFAIVLVIAMSAAWWIASSLMSNALERNLDERLNQAIGVLSEGTFPITEDVIARLGALLNADLAFLDQNGEVSLSTLTDEGLDPSLLQSRLLQLDNVGTATAELDGYRIIVNRSMRDPRFSAVAAIASTDDIRAAAHDTALWLGLASLVATLLLAFAAHLFVRSIVGPVSRLSEMAARVAEGSRDIEVDVVRDDEIGALTSALNAMTRNLAAYETELAVKTRMTALGEMSARIAHEIRNPLTAIKLKLQILAESLDGDDRTEIDAVLLEIERLELIVTSALSVSRPVGINAAPQQLNDIIEDIVTLVAPQLAHQTVAIAFVPHPLPEAEIDDARIKQLLFNLINNAAAAMPDGGTLRIATSAAGDGSTLNIDIEDSGPGIPEEDHTKLFESGQSAQGFRLGLGLKLCHEIVEAHGGSIAVGRSDDLGGARFTICLPVGMRSHSAPENTAGLG